MLSNLIKRMGLTDTFSVIHRAAEMISIWIVITQKCFDCLKNLICSGLGVKAHNAQSSLCICCLEAQIISKIINNFLGTLTRPTLYSLSTQSNQTSQLFEGCIEIISKSDSCSCNVLYQFEIISTSFHCLNFRLIWKHQIIYIRQNMWIGKNQGFNNNTLKQVWYQYRVRNSYLPCCLALYLTLLNKYLQSVYLNQKLLKYITS